jgi:RNA polymerase sigma factor (sigma-70 family)
MSPGIPTRLLATQSDERLTLLASQGHERAFEALMRRYRRALLSYCRRLGLDEAGAEDVLQQAMLKSWIALRGDNEVRAPRAWLYRVVHNTALNAIRDAAHDRDGQLDPSLPADSGDLDLDRGLRAREALTEVAALRPLQREVIVRTAIAGHSHERVASDLGISDGAVRGLLYRARASLRTAVSAVTPPPLLGLLLRGASDGGGAAPERFSELASGAGTASLGGLLVKGGVAMVAAGTLVTGAVVVHTRAPTRHHRSELASAAAPRGTVVTSPTAAASSASSTQRNASLDLSQTRQGTGTGRLQSKNGASLHVHGLRGSEGSKPGSTSVKPGGNAGSSPAATQPSTSAPVGASTPIPQTEASVHAETSPDPAGSTAATGSGGSADAPTGSQAPSGGGGSSGATSPGASETPATSETGTGSSAGPSSGESGTPGAGSESGSLVETVIKGVGGLVEGVTHGLLH